MATQLNRIPDDLLTTPFHSLSLEQRLVLSKDTDLPWFPNPHDPLELTDAQAKQISDRVFYFQRFTEATIFRVLDQARPRSLDRYTALSILKFQALTPRLEQRCREILLADPQGGERYTDMVFSHDKLGRSFRKDELAELDDHYPRPETHPNPSIDDVPGASLKALQHALYVRFWLKRSRQPYHTLIDHHLLDKLPLDLWLHLIEWSDLTVGDYAKAIKKRMNAIDSDSDDSDDDLGSDRMDDDPEDTIENKLGHPLHLPTKLHLLIALLA